MTVRSRALVAAAPVLLGAGAASLLVAAPAEAGSGRCAPGTGVTVVVDYGPLGGGTRIGCAPSGAGKPASQVVPAAGFSLTYVNGEPFVCRIDGKPGPSSESCQHTPPEDAYWGLFWSDGKSTKWTYATIGVTGLTVPKGGSIGWRFEDGGARENPSQPPTKSAAQPSPAPSRSPRPSKSPRPSASVAPHPTPSPVRTGSTPPASSAPPSGGAATPSPPASGGPAAAAPTPRGKGGSHGTGRHRKAPPDRAGTSGRHHTHPARPAHHRRVVASADTTDSATSGSGQKILMAVAASSVVLLGAAVGVAGWRRRS